jgi:hypothetical protein
MRKLLIIGLLLFSIDCNTATDITSNATVNLVKDKVNLLIKVYCPLPTDCPITQALASKLIDKLVDKIKHKKNNEVDTYESKLKDLLITKGGLSEEQTLSIINDIKESSKD